MPVIVILLWFGGVVLGAAALRPLADALAGRRRVPWFLTTDIVWLILLLQYPLVFMSWVTRRRSVDGVWWSFGSLLVAVFVYVWWRGIGALSGIGVKQPLRRGICLVVLLPTALLGMAFGPPILFVALIGLHEEHAPLIQQVAVWAGIAAVPFVWWAVNWGARWVCVVAAPVDPPNPTESFSEE